MSNVDRQSLNGASIRGGSDERTVRDALAELIIEASASFETDHYRARRCLELAAELLRRKPVAEGSVELESSTGRGGLARWQVRRVAAYVQAHIGAKICAAELAAVVNLSIGHFFRAFRASFGATPHAYIMRKRILHAKVLMASSKVPLARIAFDCGLCDQAHFSRAFRRVVGVSPNAWRRQASLIEPPVVSLSAGGP